MSRFLLIALILLYVDVADAVCPKLFSKDYVEPDTEYLFGGGSVDGLPAIAQSLIAISAGTDKSNATAKYSVTASKATDLPNTLGEKGLGCNHSLSIALSSPIDKSDNITDLATLDGLANAFTLTLTYAQYRDIIVLMPKTSGSQLDEYDIPLSWFWGGSVTIGREKFDYVDFDEFDKQSTKERPWSVSAFVGRDFNDWTITGRLKLERSYKDQDAVTRCRPIVGSMDLDCLSGSPAEPNRENGRQVSIEFRRLLLGRFGIAPTINRDFEKDVTGINLPVFLWQDAKGQLTGGWRAGWRDDTDDVEFGLFVSQPF